jgi:hypothetical protein
MVGAVNETLVTWLLLRDAFVTVTSTYLDFNEKPGA